MIYTRGWANDKALRMMRSRLKRQVIRKMLPDFGSKAPIVKKAVRGKTLREACDALTKIVRAEQRRPKTGDHLFANKLETTIIARLTYLDNRFMAMMA